MTHVNDKPITRLPKAPQPPLSHHRATPDSERAKTPPLAAAAASGVELNPGDRVAGLGNFGKPTGEIGTVEQANEDDAIVKWDGNGSYATSPTLVEEAVKYPVAANESLHSSGRPFSICYHWRAESPKSTMSSSVWWCLSAKYLTRWPERDRRIVLCPTRGASKKRRGQKHHKEIGRECKGRRLYALTLE
jgi:hypothetical protein